jgi:hypothetical protein
MQFPDDSRIKRKRRTTTYPGFRNGLIAHAPLLGAGDLRQGVIVVSEDEDALSAKFGRTAKSGDCSYADNQDC